MVFIKDWPNIANLYVLDSVIYPLKHAYYRSNDFLFHDKTWSILVQCWRENAMVFQGNAKS